jgi:hypothetical protein
MADEGIEPRPRCRLDAELPSPFVARFDTVHQQIFPMANFMVAPQPLSPRKVSFQVSVTAIDDTNGSHVTKSLASPCSAPDDDEIVLDAGGESALQRTRDGFSSLV